MFIISITWKEDKPEHLKVRAWREVLRAAHKAMGDYWLHQCLPGHFDQAKQRKYGYQPRDRWYVVKKVQSGRSAADLVYSGESREAVLTSGYARGYPTRATIIAVAPKQIGYRGKKWTGPDMVNEIERLTDDEKRACAEVLHGTFLQLMDFARGTPGAWASGSAPHSAATSQLLDAYRGYGPIT